MSLKPISITASTVTLDRDTHQDVAVVLNRAAGVTVTLPAASGSGDMYTIVVGTTVTSNSYIIQVANASDVMMGGAYIASTGTSGSFSTTSTSDTITMAGSTNGGVLGTRIVVQDVATNQWSVVATILGTGVAVSPFSAAV